MDHLILPSNPEQIVIAVPFVAKAEHHGDFRTYLERNHVSESQILNPDIANGMLPAQAIIHLQTWLYFGMLRDLTVDLDNRDGSFETLQQLFTTDNQDDGKAPKFISTHDLRRFWNDIQAHLRNQSSYEQDHYRYRIESTVQVCSQLVSNIDQKRLASDHQAVVLSIMLLCEFIMESADLRDLESSRPYLRSLLVEGIMRDGGWCLSDIERLRLDLDIGGLLYTAHCRPPPALKQHTTCTRMICEARQILRTDKYQPRHVNGITCECGSVFANMDVVLPSLEKNIVPVCRYHYGKDPPMLELLESTNVSRYVAISHVWSDKLGNREANALPHCLLKYVQEKVDGLYDPTDEHVAFWMDTISCPVTPYAARLQAISLMRETYRDAERVLVLDQYLENLDGTAMTDFEQCLRIVCTGWTRRLWTLQEGILAKRLYFQFRDSHVDGDALFMRLAEPPIAYQTAPVFHAWLEIRLSWNGELDSSVVGNAYVWMLYRALRFRRTSWAADEALCLSTITGVDIKEIVKVPQPEDRMKRLWELAPNISTALLYWDGPRINAPGLRWAPASLLCAHPESFLATHADQILKSKEVVRTKQGLVFCSPGILLGKHKTSIRKGFWLQDEHNSWYYIDLTQDIGQPKDLSGDTAVVGQLAGWDGSSPPPQILALLLDVPLGDAFQRPQAGGGNATTPACVLVSIFAANEEPNYLSAVFESAGVIRQLDFDAAVGHTEGFSVPVLANIVERELEAGSNVLGGTDEGLQTTTMDQAERKLRDFYATMKPDQDPTAKFTDDPDISAVKEDGRLSLIISGEHVMFAGRSIPASQCFCLG